MSDKSKECCANCAHLNKRNYCDRYNIYLLGMDVTKCSVCECFTPVSEISGDVALTDLSKNHLRE